MKTVIANWKMYLTLSEQIALSRGILRGIKSIKTPPNIIIAPSSLALMAISKITDKTRIRLATQNINEAEKGPRTGEISAQMARDAGATATIIGHSERRKDNNETDEKVAEKLETATQTGLDTIVCIGESNKTREEGKTEEFLTEQIDKIFKNRHLTKRSDLYIAYEPIWAIGSGRIPLLPDIIKARKTVDEALNKEGIEDYKFIYGGSVTPQNAEELLNTKEIDGLLIGGASTKIKELLEIINTASNLTPEK